MPVFRSCCRSLRTDESVILCAVSAQGPKTTILKFSLQVPPHKPLDPTSAKGPKRPSELRYGGPWSRFGRSIRVFADRITDGVRTGRIVSVIGMPLLANISGSIELGDAARQVERELQSARMTAVSANQPMRVMFNCPAAGQYRLVELIGTPAVPKPPTAPSDGVPHRLTRFPHQTTIRYASEQRRFAPHLSKSNVTFTTVTTIEFWPDGTAHTNTGLASTRGRQLRRQERTSL